MNDSNELISIIIPVYNSEKELEKCITSVINQTYKNIEIILINDGSTDNSLTICKQFSDKDKRIVLLDQINSGPSETRNAGLKIAKGAYIQFIDSDDYIPYNYTEKLYKDLLKSNADLVISPIQTINEHNELLQLWQVEDGDYYLDKRSENYFHLLLKSFLLFGPVNKIYKADLISKHKILFKPGIDYGEDLLFNIEYLIYTNKIYVTNEVIYYYLKDSVGNSLSQKNYDKRIIWAKQQHQTILEFLEKKGLTYPQNISILYERLYDSYYNEIIRIIHRRHEPLSKKHYTIKSLLTEDFWNKTMAYTPAHNPVWVKTLLKKKQIFILLLAFKLRSISKSFYYL
ncbi:glycosyltransferase [Robertkochia marina]|uniref:Glycosyltransferase n=1 Tax=Robertkochia marina TaxID=1227945 RepID=A0A4V3UY13_9FLAO|nr:glycosyltransferase [Robertkochia marina]THD66784.1 glycosyltransferase [Robertkochia marina]TRZ41925.1 glycosyltransferase [Robertkochia marina]